MHRDPMNIPELRTMISEATNRGPMTQFSGDLGLLRLPLDIQWLIANTLEDPQEISSLLIAFRWQLPDGYWRARFGKELAGVVFEFEHLVHNIDWRYLYYGTLKLMKMSWLAELKADIGGLEVDAPCVLGFDGGARATKERLRQLTNAAVYFFSWRWSHSYCAPCIFAL